MATAAGRVCWIGTDAAGSAGDAAAGTGGVTSRVSAGASGMVVASTVPGRDPPLL